MLTSCSSVSVPDAEGADDGSSSFVLELGAVRNALFPRRSYVPYGDIVPIRSRRVGLITPIDYLEAGETEVSRYLASSEQGDQLRDVLARFSMSCVRLRTYVRAGDDFEIIQGCGVLVDRGRYVLTAAHILPEQPFEGDVHVALAGGGILTAKVVARGRSDSNASEDWALLELEGERDPTPALGSPRKGEICVVLGYPGGNAGRLASGGLVEGQSTWGEFLVPVPTIARVERISRREVRLAPVAGHFPWEGASGGPILDSRGNLIAILGTTSVDFQARGVTYEIGGVPIGSVGSLQDLQSSSNSDNKLRIIGSD